MATGGLFPSISTFATLGTFIPPDASADIKSRVNHAGVTERALWTDSIFSETTVQVHDYRTDVLPQGAEAMRLLPDTTLGNFFNQQHRSAGIYQVDGLLKAKLRGSGLERYVEVLAHIDTEAEKRLVPLYKLEI